MFDAKQELEQVVVRMVRESGDPDGFDSTAWLDNWMASPIPALDGNTPQSMIGTPEGFAQVKTILLCMQSGAYC